MTKNAFVGIIAVIALALLWTVSNVTATSSFGFVAASIVLMLAYCVGQYKLSKNYR